MYAVVFQPNLPAPLTEMMTGYLCTSGSIQFAFSKIADLEALFADLELVDTGNTAPMRVSLPVHHILAVVELSDHTRKIGFLSGIKPPLDSE